MADSPFVLQDRFDARGSEFVALGVDESRAGD